MADAAAENEPIRSKYRGLSWDKKYAGWRVRVYYAGKQRHVGRYEDEIAAAQAYDKAVVCLYRENAITNFGLEACLKDPTEVSVFILQAKEKAEQEQQAKAQQKQLQHQQHRPFSSGSTASSPQVQPVLHHGMVLSPQVVAYQQHAQQQLPVQQQQLLAVDYAFLQQQLQSTGDMAFTNGSLQAQVASSRGLAGSQHCRPPAGDPSTYVLMSSPLAQSISDVSCATSSNNNFSNNGGLSSSNSTVSSSTSSYMLCSTLSGQTVVLPVVQAASAASMHSTPDASFASPAQLQQQQQHQLQRQQPHLQLPQYLQSAQQHQQFAFLGQGEPLQLSVQPELTTIAGHMSAAAEAGGIEQQQQFLQQLQGLTLLESAVPAYPGMFQVSNAASSSNPQLGTAMQQYPPQLQANALIHNTVFGMSPDSDLDLGLAPVPSVPCSVPVVDSSMSWGLQQYGPSPGAVIAAAAGGLVSTAMPREQQAKLLVMPSMPCNSCTSAFDCTSSSCSPMTVTSIQFESSMGRAGSAALAMHAAQTNTSLKVLQHDATWGEGCGAAPENGHGQCSNSKARAADDCDL